MPTESTSENIGRPAGQWARINRACDAFEAAWRAGQRPAVEDYLRDARAADRAALLLELVRLDAEARRLDGEDVRPDDYAARFPGQADVIDEALGAQQTPCHGPPPRATHEPLPEWIGRYRVEHVLGLGGFGTVYLAHDDQLHRPVAIKVPHRRLVARPEDAEPYLAEARAVAGLDHPGIVPVFDAGGTAEFPCFVVSRYMGGGTLAEGLRRGRPLPAEAAALAAAVAEALHHAHKQGLVHRDVKPGNILFDNEGRPYLADFGLALREAHAGRGPRFAGTPAYMSPEQARGEGHRVDGRSDVFSLGVVLYEMLTGRRPFPGDTAREVLAQVTGREARPPRQWDDTIPRELERICLKALAKRAGERYTTARDLAEDLRCFLACPAAGAAAGQAGTPPPPPPGPPSVSGSALTSGGEAVWVVPRGLRSFDAHDADFFLELLPGPRDRQGLPESIRFWKARVEETDPGGTFAVGLLYGPSGCGKSSLVKAGLLPRLARHVTAVYVEATGGETEARLLAGLGRRCPGLPPGTGLAEALAAVRLGQGAPAGGKLLLVLDQFEQWLHARGAEPGAELVRALRQCDGGRVQALVLVRDDFWMAATRFLRELEARLLEGQNSAAVDLFDPDHARKVLAAFGRAFGKLPGGRGRGGREGREFLARAVDGLAEGGKVVCVRLALFAEMMKGRPWTPAALKAVGGAAGVGVTFLEETFSAATAPPEHRLHQRAARALLAALLPGADSELRGVMRSRQELLAASGYAARPRDFDDLLRILDGELRLITPTDPEGRDDEPGPAAAGARYYQLTHDYLVPALREWLTRKQRQTRRGRAELRLAERAELWGRKPEGRHLPSGWEWLAIALLVPRATRTPLQARMMRQAGRALALRGLALAAVLLVLLAVAGQWASRVLARGRLNDLLQANREELPAAAREAVRHGGGLAAALEGVLDEPAAAAGESARVARARRQANAATALAALGRWERVWPLLAHSPDPTRRSFLLDRLGPAGAEARPVLDRLAPGREPDPSVRRALILALGDFGEPQLGRLGREAVAVRLREVYRTDPDPGLHGAAGWLLRTLGRPDDVAAADDEFQARDRGADQAGAAPPDGRGWYVNAAGGTMVVAAPGRFDVEAVNDKGQLRPVRVDRPFALAAREVTVAEFRRFQPEHQFGRGDWVAGDDCPVGDVTWYEAAAYCNWLSRQAGLPETEWCYRPNARGEYAEGMSLAPDWPRRAGYRLPTEAEWEYACRAGSATKWSMGDAEELLGKYAWYDRNADRRVHPVGRLRPNDLGLFDAHGGLWEWCQDRLADPGVAGPPAPAAVDVIGDRSGRPMRGGAFIYFALDARSNARGRDEAAVRNYYGGFRPARTQR